MIPGVLIGLVWLSVGWRGWLTWRDQASPERVSLTVALGFFAATATAWVYGRELNGWIGVPNLSTLVMRVTLGACWIAAQPFVARFLHARVEQGAAPRSRRWVIVVTSFMMGSSVLLWGLASLHDAELQTLDAAADVWTSLFIFISYAWVVVLLGELMIASARAFFAMANDPAGRVSAVFLWLTGVLGLIGIALLSLERILFVGSHEPSVIGRAGSAFMPAAAAATALGMLCVPALEWVLSQVAARRQIRTLKPNWLAVCRERPELIVSLGWWTRLLDAPLLAERMRIEVDDALELANRGRTG